jgi:hypothetical protein
MTPTGHPAPAWFDISSPDALRARRFYQEMFGWPVNLLDETRARSPTPPGASSDWSAADDREHPHTTTRLLRARYSNGYGPTTGDRLT